MKSKTCSMTFVIDDRQVSVTFADSADTAVSNRVKQILLNSYANHIPNRHFKDILAIPEPQGIM